MYNSLYTNIGLSRNRKKRLLPLLRARYAPVISNTALVSTKVSPINSQTKGSKLPRRPVFVKKETRATRRNVFTNYPRYETTLGTIGLYY